ncbi:endonuclease domain-containing protein [Streptomyces sp. BA2]|uniref:endonuclease domain-containing protein n=1 Tax=Streptomyces sp. BA2 TaxID=436595 RepID=UPI001328B856|nr:hypothetical protein [Streptomyces sp. BA2]MWA11797.1 hypothetical protein [Streptomyces sp. BA2]
MGGSREPRGARKWGGLRELAVEGVLLTCWAREAGWPTSTLSRSLAAEGWTRIPGGGWAEPGRAVDLTVRLWAGQLTMPGLVASHRSAAKLWRIEVLREELEFTDPQGTRRKTGAHVHWRPLPPAEITVVGDLRVTTVARTLADLLRGGPREEALVALDSALSSRRYGGRCWRGPLIGGLDTVAAALDSPPAAGAAGAARARRWLALADPGAGSPAETVARLRMGDAGLRPESQAGILTPSGRLLRPDFFFRGEGVVVEIEGYAYHGTREAHRRDLARYNDLASCPEVRVVLRFGAEEVFNAPEAFVERVRAAVAGQGETGSFA